MGWYGFFSLFYDASLEKLYAPYRARVAEAARAQAGDAVLELCCGTGQGLASLVEAVAPDGAVVGLDRSRGMLRRARKRVRRHGWTNVTLLEADVQALDVALLEAAGAPTGFDAVVCSLGLTAVPDWRGAFERAWDRLVDGGRFVIFDCHAEGDERRFQTRSVELVARADLSRRVWEPLEAASSDFAMESLEGDPKTFGGRLFLAAGTKPAAAEHAAQGAV